MVTKEQLKLQEKIAYNEEPYHVSNAENIAGFQTHWIVFKGQKFMFRIMHMVRKRSGKWVRYNPVNKLFQF